MDGIELTPEQRVAQATIEMFKTFRSTIIFIIAVSVFGTGTGVYSGWAASKELKNYITKAQYEKERARDIKERDKLYKKLEQIHDIARETKNQINLINQREEMRKEMLEQQARATKK